jgi:hypothetical protein
MHPRQKTRKGIGTEPRDGIMCVRLQRSTAIAPGRHLHVRFLYHQMVRFQTAGLLKLASVESMRW